MGRARGAWLYNWATWGQVGKVTNDPDLEISGNVEKNVGKVQQVIGNAEKAVGE
jgi:uncharacterized protein YjbJ (UPF0337 family)